MKLFGIVGHPVAHSRSPAMHDAAFRALGIDASYERFDIAPSVLSQGIVDLRARDVCGFNVTVPHKIAIMPLLDEVDHGGVGAVNTVVRDGDRLVGSNTDADGFLRAMEEHGFDARGCEALVLGTGGAARAAITGLERAGAKSITVAARKVAPGIVPLGSLDLRHTTLLVQATSAPLDPIADRALADLVPLAQLPREALVHDLAYGDTELVRRAQALGLRAMDGTAMLLHQGALAFQRFTGRPAPLDVMRCALRGHVPMP